MDLKAVAAKPKLERVTIDNPDIVAAVGEPLEFYMWDRQSMSTYVRLSSIDKQDLNTLLREVKNLVLDSEGKPMLSEDDELPIDVLTETVNAVVARLGNLQSQTLTK